MVLIEDLVREVPPVTRILCGGSILLHFLIHIQAITKYDVYFNLDLITSKFQIWRIFTNIVYFEDIHIVTFFCILFLYRCSKKLEQQIFKNNIADYLFFLLTGITIMTLYGIYMGFTNLSKPFLTMLLYLWSRYNRNAIFLVLGIFPIKAPYITWFSMLMNIKRGEPISYDVIGIGIAHIFYFFHEVYPKLPQSKGVRVLKTPQLFVKLINALNIQPQGGFAAFDEDMAFDDDQGGANRNAANQLF